MAKKYEVYFVVTDADGNVRPVVMRTWADSPIDAINQAKKRDKTAKDIVCKLYIPREK